MSTTMRAKFQIGSVEVFGSSEQVKFHAVAAKAYPADGNDEDNTFAKWSPSAECKIMITNPALFGQFKPGDKFYVNFTPAE
jgi:hypothetical protein